MTHPDLSTLLNWRLLAGPHRFPGPDGGTCINEAAIVVAGYKYRRVASAEDMPDCFSRVLSAYALSLNDRMGDDVRQELLLPFVTRLAGTADAPEIERARADRLVIRTSRDILPPLLRRYRLDCYATLCEQAETLTEIRLATNKTRHALEPFAIAHNAHYAASVYAAVDRAYDAAAVRHVDVVDAATHAAGAAAYAAVAVAVAAHAVADSEGATPAKACAYVAAEARRHVWIKAVDVLDAAMSIGRQAEPIETALVVERADAAKRWREIELQSPVK